MVPMQLRGAWPGRRRSGRGQRKKSLTRAGFRLQSVRHGCKNSEIPAFPDRKRNNDPGATAITERSTIEAREARETRAAPPGPPRVDPHSRVPAPDSPDAHRVSVIIPARNAEDVLPAALDSILAQDYPGSIEVVVADGSDHPAMADMLRRRYPTVRTVPNPEGTTPTGLNHALRDATGEIIVRCDANARLPPGYVRQAVAKLVETGASNVGGRQCPKGSTMFGRALSMATTTWLGTGGARYRIGGAEGPVDTVYLGAWFRKTLEDVGGFDSAVLTNQDYELNWRLRERGLVVWFDPALVVEYRPRENPWKLAAQYFMYGRGKSLTLRMHPASLRVRQLPPPLLLLALAVSAGLAVAGTPWPAGLLCLGYLSVLAVGALAAGLRHRDSAAVLLPPVLLLIHLSWGIGLLSGFFSRRRVTGTVQLAPPPPHPRPGTGFAGAREPPPAGKTNGFCAIHDAGPRHGAETGLPYNAGHDRFMKKP